MEDPHQAAPAQSAVPAGPANPVELELHESVAIFPPLRDVEFEALVADIKEHGQLEPIWTYQGKVIDGRHRLLACKKLGLAPRTREWDGNGSLLEFVISANLRRRHLKENQRAMVAARMLPHFEAEALKRMHHSGDGGPVANWRQGRSGVHAGEALNISPRSVERARKLLESGIPALIARVDAGTLAISLAAKIAKFPADEQAILVNLSRAEIAKTLRAWLAAPPDPAAQREEEQQIAKLIANTQIGQARLQNTPQGLRLELPYSDCLDEFYRLNRDRYHLLDLLDRGVFIVRRPQQAS